MLLELLTDTNKGFKWTESGSLNDGNDLVTDILSIFHV